MIAAIYARRSKEQDDAEDETKSVNWQVENGHRQKGAGPSHMRRGTPIHPHEHDERDRRALFDRVWELLQHEAAQDPTLLNFDRRPTMFSLSRHGHSLIYAFGAGNRIADGEIRWRPNPDGDQPHPFRVMRSTANPQRFQFDHEEALELDAVAQRIVQEYLRATEPA